MLDTLSGGNIKITEAQPFWLASSIPCQLDAVSNAPPIECIEPPIEFIELAVEPLLGWYLWLEPGLDVSVHRRSLEKRYCQSIPGKRVFISHKRGRRSRRQIFHRVPGCWGGHYHNCPSRFAPGITTFIALPPPPRPHEITVLTR
jgi:hypothetical protein